MSPRYRWDSPYEWLEEQARGWNATRLYAELMNLAQLVGNDAIQDSYQSEMDQDGYFDAEPDDPEGGAR